MGLQRVGQTEHTHTLTSSQEGLQRLWEEMLEVFCDPVILLETRIHLY